MRSPQVEERVLRRIEKKAATYGHDVDFETDLAATCKIAPAAVAELYRRHVIPLTIEVEVRYLFARLD